MDPNVALADLRRALDRREFELAGSIMAALDSWLSAGGPAPWAWTALRRPAAPPAEAVVPLQPGGGFGRGLGAMFEAEEAE